MNVLDLRKKLEQALEIAQQGCLDGNCKILPKTEGMRTNGGCNCEFYIKRKLEYILNRLGKERLEPLRDKEK